MPERLPRQIQRVSDLIDEDIKECKRDLVSQCFLPQDADAILSVPLSVTGARDRVIWAKKRNKRFTVKNAYRLVQKDQWDKEMVEGSNQLTMKQTWRRLWQMNVPNKVKHSAWKACRNILATKENLWWRNIIKDSTCEVCREQVESICHLFWFCDHVKEVWSSCKLSFPFEIHPSWDYMDVICHLQKWEESRPGIFERTVMICWGIWKDRNEVRHGGKLQSGLLVTRSSLSLLEEFQIANERPKAIAERNHVVKWVPSQLGGYKVNVDGAVFSKSK